MAVNAVDRERIVTILPGVTSMLGDDAQNQMLNPLAPCTVHRQAERFRKLAPQQLASLLEIFRKPVIGDEPRRASTAKFNAIEDGMRTQQHIERIRRAREIGGYRVHHHDWLQNGYDQVPI